MRRLAGRVGTVQIADMKAARQFTAPGDDLERLLYGFSLLICLPDSMSSPGSAATGTVLRPGTVRDYAIQAGYTRIDTLPVDHDLWRFLPPAPMTHARPQKDPAMPAPPRGRGRARCGGSPVRRPFYPAGPGGQPVSTPARRSSPSGCGCWAGSLSAAIRK